MSAGHDTVTANRPGPYRPGGNRNGERIPYSDAVTDERPGAYASGPRPVTCTWCGNDVAADDTILVVGRGVSYKIADAIRAPDGELLRPTTWRRISQGAALCLDCATEIGRD